jgi:hypothetical protein
MCCTVQWWTPVPQERKQPPEPYKCASRKQTYSLLGILLTSLHMRFLHPRSSKNVPAAPSERPPELSIMLVREMTSGGKVSVSCAHASSTSACARETCSRAGNVQQPFSILLTKHQCGSGACAINPHGFRLTWRHESNCERPESLTGSPLPTLADK